MRIIKADVIYQSVKEICREVHYVLPEDVVEKLEQALISEEDELARDVLGTIKKNYQLASDLRQPLCQDTGIGIFFVEIGNQIDLSKLKLSSLLSQAMRDAYLDNHFRASVVFDPLFNRLNTTDNRPPIIHWDIVEGDRMTITFLPKGGGAENTSRVKMFTPLDSEDDIVDFVKETIVIAGGKPCPPLVVGIGIGGSFDYACYLAKKSLLRPLTEENENKRWAELEIRLLEEINRLGIGPMGLGGSTTALAVSISTHPCHMASLPVAVNLQCHSHRYKRIVI